MTASTPRIEGYDDLQVIGRGGFSTVYSATQVDLGRRVAVKVLNFDVSETAAQRRFERECKVVGMLSGVRGVVGVHTPAFTEDGRPCIVMQLMEGGTLQAHVLDDGPIGAHEACELTQRLAEALAAAHAREVAHRDIKPGNVLLTADREPALADFGIAVVDHLACSSQTVESLSPPFAAPERLLGGEIDEKRADIYSLGATICFALTGAAPFGTVQRGGVSGLVRRVLEDPPPSLEGRGLQADFTRLVVSMLAKQPENRPESASAIAQSCQQVAADSTRIAVKPECLDPTTEFGYSLDPSASASVASVTGLGLATPAAPPVGPPPPYNPPQDPHSGLMGEAGGQEEDRDAGVWPTAVDYAQAIQDTSSLLDAGLAQVTLKEDMLGMPVSAAGQSAVVFHVLDQGAGAAVRFFTRPPRDGRIRYRALGDHLQTYPCDSVVSARWVEDAITVGDHDRPAVWMPWAEGRPLNLLVEDLLDDPRRLHSLAELWLDVLDDLRGSGMAHGDLQNGNILVTEDLSISLVDLDGVWVPTLTGNPPAETGHLCFQHSARSARHWGPEMDTFSGLLIYTSLVALSVDPGLWRFHQGENLILTARDLQSSPESEAWRALLSSRSAQVRSLAGMLAELASVAEPPSGAVRELVDSTGSLDDVTVRRSGGTTPADNDPAPPVTPYARREQPSPVASESDWWVDPPALDLPDPGGAVAARSSGSGTADPVSGIDPVPPVWSSTSSAGAPDPDSAADSTGWRRFAGDHPGWTMPLVALCCGMVGLLAEFALHRLWEPGSYSAITSMGVVLVVSMSLLGGSLRAWPDVVDGRNRDAARSALLGAVLAAVLTSCALLVLVGTVEASGNPLRVPIGQAALFMALVFGAVGGAVGFTRSTRAGFVLGLAGLIGGSLAAIPVARHAWVSANDGDVVVMNGGFTLAVALAMLLAGAVIGFAMKHVEEVSP